MADETFSGLFSSLGASFDAVKERDEDEAAADLAFSLRQDLRLEDVVGRGSFALRWDSGARFLVTEVGTDYVGTGTPLALIVPSLRAVLVEATESPQAIVLSGVSMLARLRGWSRAGEEVQISTSKGSVQGALRAVTEDHLEVAALARVTLVGWEALESVRLVRWG